MRIWAALFLTVATTVHDYVLGRRRRHRARHIGEMTIAELRATRLL